MALSKRSKLLIAGGVLLAVGIVLFALIPRKPPVTVTFNRFEGDTAVLIINNRSTNVVPCWWEGWKWLESPKNAPYRQDSFQEAAGRAVWLGPGTNELKLTRTIPPHPEANTLKMMTELPPGTIRRGVYNLSKKRIALRNRLFLTVQIPPTNAPNSSGARLRSNRAE